MGKGYKRDLKEECNILRGIIKEAYVFNEEEPIGDAAPQTSNVPTEQQPMQEPQEQTTDKSFDRVAKIRKVAIDGIQEYADDVNNPLYTFYKKVFNEADKVMSDKAHSAQQQDNSQQI